METVTSIADLYRCRDRIKSAMSNLERFPNPVFRAKVFSYAFLDYGYVTSEIFFQLMKELCTLTDEDGFTFVVTNPDAKSYYFERFRWLPAANFSRNDDTASYAQFVLHDPGGSPADAIAYRADEIAIISDSSAFVGYGTRGSELVALGVFRPGVNLPLKPDPSILMDSAMAYDHLTRFRNVSYSQREFVKSWADALG